MENELKKKQIEEMVKDLYGIQTYATMEIYPCDQKQPNEIVAEHLVRKGWIKPDENVVVMTREDWESEAYVRAMENYLCKKCRERIGEEYEKLQEKIRILEVQLDLERTRTLEQWFEIKQKQTAKKYHEEMKRVIHERDYVNGYAEIGLQEENDEIAKQFGVEIGENNED